MKTIIYNNEMDTVKVSNISNMSNNRSFIAFSGKDKREVRFMNLISSVIFRDNDAKERNKDRSKHTRKEDLGYNLYKSLEFSNDREKALNHNTNFELMRNRLY